MCNAIYPRVYITLYVPRENSKFLNIQKQTNNKYI